MARDSIAERKHRSFWIDPRFGVGLALVAASVAGVTFLVYSADRTTEVYVAASSIASGQRVTADDLTVAHVRLGGAAALYLAPSEVPASGVLAVRPIGSGELVPADAVGSLRAQREASVVVTVAGPLPEAVADGDRVTLWASAETERGYDPPVALVDHASVVRILEAVGLIAAGSDVQVELLVPREAVAAVLEATANGAALALVPDDQPLGR